jgi:phosphomannomutase
VEANLADLRDAVAAHALQFGVAFDGDGDRIGVVDSMGRVIWGDQLMMIFAEDVLQARPGAAIVADVKASNHLFARIRALGGQAHMWKTGHSLIKSRMAEIGAPLGGEMTGHICFADSYFGFDDALYAAIRLIVATVRLGRSVTALRSAMPESVNTPELRFPVAEERKFAVIADVMERLRQSGATVETIDGARVTTPDGWWLLRASNTQAALTARAESDDADGLARLLDAIDAQLAASGVAREAGSLIETRPERAPPRAEAPHRGQHQDGGSAPAIPRRPIVPIQDTIELSRAQVSPEISAGYAFWPVPDKLCDISTMNRGAIPPKSALGSPRETGASGGTSATCSPPTTRGGTPCSWPILARARPGGFPSDSRHSRHRGWVECLLPTVSTRSTSRRSRRWRTTFSAISWRRWKRSGRSASKRAAAIPHRTARPASAPVRRTCC